MRKYRIMHAGKNRYRKVKLEKTTCVLSTSIYIIYFSYAIKLPTEMQQVFSFFDKELWSAIRRFETAQNPEDRLLTGFPTACYTVDIIRFQVEGSA